MDSTQATKPAASVGFMDKMIGGKTLKEYLGIIKIPLLILIAMDVVQFLLGFVNYIPLLNIITGIISILVAGVSFLISVAIGVYIGYVTVKKHGGNLLPATFAGTLAGFLSGVVSGVLSFISGMIGAGVSGSGWGMGVGIMFSVMALILSPIVGIISGAVLGVIGGLIAGARKFGGK